MFLCTVDSPRTNLKKKSHVTRVSDVELYNFQKIKLMNQDLKFC